MTSFTVARKAMIERHIKPYGICNEKLLDVMGSVPRHLFVSQAMAAQAYSNNALPIGKGQTISQPLMVARMTQDLHLSGKEKVLEIGTGCGYQTAILSQLAKAVYTIEYIE